MLKIKTKSKQEKETIEKVISICKGFKEFIVIGYRRDKVLAIYSLILAMIVNVFTKYILPVVYEAVGKSCLDKVIVYILILLIVLCLSIVCFMIFTNIMLHGDISSIRYNYKECMKKVLSYVLFIVVLMTFFSILCGVISIAINTFLENMKTYREILVITDVIISIFIMLVTPISIISLVSFATSKEGYKATLKSTVRDIKNKYLRILIYTVIAFILGAFIEEKNAPHIIYQIIDIILNSVLSGTFIYLAVKNVVKDSR